MTAGWGVGVGAGRRRRAAGAGVAPPRRRSGPLGRLAAV